ncbi:jg12530 [Pararge aegeria aegeria]|uniref:Jg12530 protein n=1 Tax=Pararge aegeria aegeria TaxID=348720 RepID=A0A8S4QN95_9NEOP|nr:jg12530 [Pararge aegeria aegeria]
MSRNWHPGARRAVRGDQPRSRLSLIMVQVRHSVVVDVTSDADHQRCIANVPAPGAAEDHLVSPPVLLGHASNGYKLGQYSPTAEFGSELIDGPLSPTTADLFTLNKICDDVFHLLIDLARTVT